MSKVDNAGLSFRFRFDYDGCVYVFQWKIFVIIASYLTNFEKCGIKHVNI